MANIVIVGILVAAVFLALRSSVRHFAGKGACCGGGSEVIRERKRLEVPIMAEKTIKIDGMKCESCAARVERALNKIDGAACEVDLKAGVAKLSLGREVSDDEIRRALGATGYSFEFSA